MIITCPKCETAFSLPDDLYRPGKKARCSQCSFVFQMPAEENAEEHDEPIHASYAFTSEGKSSGTSKRTFLFLGLAGALVLVLLYGAYLIYSSYTPSRPIADAMPPVADATPAPVTDSPQRKAEQLINSISLDDIRQFLVDNVEIGRLMVIQGFAVNNGDTLKDYIRVEARILDEDNNVLLRAQQVCGVPLTLFQLQTLSEKDLEETLNNRTTILVNNTNVPQEGKVPFVVVFPNPPDIMRTFEVQVVDVQASPAS